MRTLPSAAARRVPSASFLAGLMVLLLALTACVPTPAEGPEGVVGEALAKLAAGDVEGMRDLACAGQEDLLREQLGFSGAVGDELIPGLDTEALFAAVRLDVGGLQPGQPVIDGDVAQVPVTGTLKVTFDADAMRPILRDVLAQQGTTMTDEQLDALLSTLEAYGQDVPVDESVRLVREAGGWRICQDTLEVPAGS